MKLLMVVQPIEKGGSANIFLDNVEFLINKGIDVELIISHKGRFSEFCENNRIKHYIIGHMSYYIGGGSTPIRKLLKRVMYPVICIKYVIKREIAVKKAISMIDFDSIDAIYSNYNGDDIGAILANRFNKKHIWHIREFGEIDFGCISLRKNYINFMNNSNSVFIAISDAVKSWWIKKGINENSIVRIYDSVKPDDMNRYLIRANNSQKIKCIFVGKIHPNKGQEQLIDAIKLIESAKERITIDFYGSGPKDYLIHLKRKIRKQNLNEVFRFMGYYKGVRQILADYDIGFVCSKSEGFGLVTVEYMLAGLTVIGADSGATKEIVKDNETGLIYEYGNIKSLVEKIVIAMNDVCLRKRLGDNARIEARKNNKENRDELYNFLKEIV